MTSSLLPSHRHVLRCVFLRASGGLEDEDGVAMAHGFTKAVTRVWGPDAHVSNATRVSPIAIEVLAVASSDWDAPTQRRMLEDTLVAFSHESLAFGETRPGAPALQWIFSQKRDDGSVYQGTTLHLHTGLPRNDDVALQVRAVDGAHIYQNEADLARLRQRMQAAAAALTLRTDPDLRLDVDAPARPVRHRL